MKKNATVKIVLDPQSKEPSKSVKLRITFNRVSRLRAIPSTVKLTDDEFANDKLKKTKEVLAEARMARSAAEAICNELGASFTWVEFELRYKKAVWGKEVVMDVDDWETLLQAHFNRKRLAYSTQDNYRNAVKWIIRFHPDATIADVTSEFVAGWIEFIRRTHKQTHGRDVSINTIGMYARAIRALYNDAVEKKLVVNTHPFARIIETAPRQKRAVDSEDWVRFVAYEPEPNSNMEFAHDFALLSFALCGANMKDILSLKNYNIVGDMISFMREKTERVGTIVNVPFGDAAKSIMEKYGELNPQKPNAFIFPFFEGVDSQKSVYYKRDSVLKKVNRGVADICDVLKIEKFTTYQIRHTFAVLSRDMRGFTTEQLMKLLGHKNITTTQIYLNSITRMLMTKTSGFIGDMLGM